MYDTAFHREGTEEHREHKNISEKRCEIKWERFMNQMIKIREYFVAWILLALGLTLIESITVGLGRALVGDYGKHMTPLTTYTIRLGSWIVGLVLSFILFVWIIRSMIVRKVEKCVKQAAQTAEEINRDL